jgi:hypothetical protein
MRVVFVLMLVACGGEVATRYSDAEIGAPCIPAIESEASFRGFDIGEVSVELPNPTADPGQLVCLADHFRGRVTCPYGQDASGCTTPDGNAVVGEVDAQCTDRRAADVVTWSCRCANADGRTDDGASYCSCGDGLTCTQLVTPLPGDDTGGAYCIKTGTDYAPSSSCSKTCDPTSAKCP